jgi:GNAT superfamily N-acetyltransferase
MITRRCHDCDAELVSETYDDFADVFLSHVRSAHADWPFPDAAVRMVGENVARLTGSTERLEEVGPVAIEPVTEARLDDWAAFFDHDSHAGNPVGGACYCTEAHVIERGKPLPPHPGWRAHRELMLDLLRTGRAFGYLAYVDGRAAGWINASRRSDYSLHRVGPGATPDDAEVVAIACFVIAPPYRRHGLAAQLLDRVIADASSRRVRWVEAYPFTDGARNGSSHRGARAMYEQRGFDVVEQRSIDTVMRRPV